LATLIRRFRKALGMTPGEYLRDQRLSAAKRLLVQTNRPISAIAQMVGFPDPRSFRELFRRGEGTSARACRRTAADPAIDHSCD
jgi:transcriptional regulator GlxA family with amidase domain